MHIHSYLASAELILSQYNGDKPFDIFRKTFFAAHKKYGSKDRKHITHLCYSYFRLGTSFDQQPFEEKLLIAQFLTSTISNVFLQQLKPEWNVHIGLSLIEKFGFLNAADEWKKIYPWHNELSPDIDKEDFIMSHLKQPDVFLRIRPGKESKVRKKLEDAGAEYAIIKHSTLAFPPNFKANEIFEIDKEVVVQDLSSQQVIDPLIKVLQNTQSIKVWDCCAASGGKSLLLYDFFKDVHLTVSDIRKSILYNLHSRFKRAGITNYNSFIADISQQGFVSKEKYDLVICDAPCSGSGTWSRTPEQLMYFDSEKINHYQQLQEKIVINASRSVKNGGYLLYITCSVFKKENEDVMDHILQHTPLKCVHQQYFTGYAKRADTLYVALFRYE